MHGEHPLKAVMLGSDGRHALDSTLLDALPAAVYTTDAAGRITYYNQAAAELWGHRPALGKSEWRGLHTLYRPDGTPLPEGESPLAIALRERRPVRGMEAIIERPDGTRIPIIAFPTPLQDAGGGILGAVNMLVDISDRKSAEQAHQLLASIVESSDDAIVSKDLQGIIVSWNGGAERLFGYSAEEARGKPITLVIPKERIHEEETILRQIRSGERIDHFDTVRRRKDGSLVDISLTISPVKDADGRIVGASKIARDITERKRAEEALARRAEEQAALYQFTNRLHRAGSFEDVHDAALEAIVRALRCQRAATLMLDPAGKMRFVSWRGLSDGYRRASEGPSPWPIDAADPQSVCVNDVAKADLEPVLKSGIEAEGIGALASIPLVTHGRPIGKIMAYYDTPHDFTEAEMNLAVTIARQLGFGLERLQAEETRSATENALRRSEARERAHAAELRTIMEAVPAVMFIARDPSCQVIDGNPHSYEVLRIPRTANQSLSAPEEDRPGNFQVLVEGRVLTPDELPVQRAARGEEIRNFEEEVRFEDGTSRFLLGNATPLRDAEGRLSGAVAAFVDITDRKKAEEQRDLLVAELSHRVKNTLATVISIAQRSFAGRTDIEDARASFASRIRALAQTHSRLAETSWSGASLEAMLRDEFAPYIRDAGGNLHIAGPSTMLSATCALTLGMAIHELVTNAAKYGALSTERGTVSVTWQEDASERQLRIRWVESGGPPVKPPSRSGFGRLLLERALSYDLGGEVQLNFASAGLECAITVPLDAHVARIAGTSDARTA